MFTSSKTELAREMGLALHTVVRLSQKKGCPGKGKEGYDVDAWKVWHDKTRVGSHRMPIHAPAGVSRGPTTKSDAAIEARTKTLPELRAEEAALKIEERKLKIGKLNGELIPREVVVMVLGKFVSELRTRLMAIKAQAPRLAMMTDVVKIEQLLEENITGAMDGVSRLPYQPADPGKN